MADAPSTPTNPPPADGSDSARKQRAQMEALLARPAAQSRGHLASTDGPLDYTVHAAFLPVAGDAASGGEPEAAVLTTAYTLEGADPASRPVCFAFNGGPGSASIWLHLGALGPKRVVVPDDGAMAPPPYAVQDNPESWLAFTDLVFIDPPHTGWSLTAGDDARKKMLSVDGDVAALAEVMRLWLTRHRRWGSPIYLCGESYGTTRGAALTDKLQGMGIAVSGAILVSLAMDLQSLVFAPANDLPYALFLPAFANVAQFHGLLKGPLAASPEAARAAAEAFVDEDYAAALLAGARLDPRRRSTIARRVAELTGLDRALVEAQDLRISDQTYFMQALRHRGQVLGRLDARGTAPLAAQQGHSFEFDPGMEAIVPAYTMAAMGWFAALGLDLDTPYQVLNREVHKGWNWQRGESSRNGFASTSPDLALALRRNNRLRVLACSGRYDLGTPYSASDWSLAGLDIPAAVRERVTPRYYDAGHMMYTRQADLSQMRADVAAWVAG